MSYMVSIEESIKDILITPLGSRVMRPEYGSLLYTLIDRKIDDDFKIKLTRYTAEAISKWEKRVRLKGARLNECKSGILSIALFFENYPNLNLELGNE
ncbi:baseplate assembly protein [Campylobacter sp. MIT 99-7217]|uniref:GPW/gp25 family protein n=1 Tax=Campylobacter sp. MIT 99-7217 TaxID=535091 RepID=UPI00115BBA2E|nr:GPW/gp25 family protein [Campylobacter sp. MIT 99-7217]TQR29154.1 baseplate assembly protein [Campylobacter sp. MIT 99-7217]